MPTPDRHVVLALPSTVLFPHDVTTFDIVRPENLCGLTRLEPGRSQVLVRPLFGPEEECLLLGSVASIGTLARLVNSTPLADGAVRVVLHGLQRVAVEDAVVEEGVVLARATTLPEPAPCDADEVVELDRLRTGLHAVEELDPAFTGGLATTIKLYGDDSERITDLAASVLPLTFVDRARLLAEEVPARRLQLLVGALDEHLLGLRARPRPRRGPAHGPGAIAHATSHRDDAETRRTPPGHDLGRLEARLDHLKLPEAAEHAFRRELALLWGSPPGTQEAARTRGHLEWALELPWTPRERRHKPLPFERVARALDRSHVGLEEVKKRIAEMLAIRELGGGARGTVLCFEGPPGTGKSSMARAVANALGRPFLTIPVGATLHDRELIGVSRRREGAAPGAILAGIHRCGQPDPVILLDEIDKLSLGGEGTAAGALALLLDPEHNAEFLDSYLGVPFDLSRCLFLATANDVEDLPANLIDRMEFLSFHGYTESEKYAIARRHLLPRARTHAGVDGKSLRVSPAALRDLIRGYTEEAGIRHLQRLLVSLARKAAVDVVHGGSGLDIKKDELVDLLGPRTVEEELRLRRPAIGVATGLAWTSVGGALLPIEALAMPGSGRMILTGSLGEVLQESVQTVLSYLRTCFGSLGLPQGLLEELDLHLHFPSAATPKDGPSAGIAIATALVSLFTKRPMRHDVALTGEVSLLGAVLPIGGLREKLLAAIRCGIPEVVVPSRNGEDVLRLQPEIRSRVTIHLVENVQQVLDIALLEGGGEPGTAATIASAKPRAARRAKRLDADAS
jgi:ATP-dependent Lon protease